jgi:peptidoglycan-N-acetylglucosamine deacetylase
MNWVLTPTWLKIAFPQLVWNVPTSEKIIYLTFDDGPTPEITSRVLDLLAEHRAISTFFCLGSQIKQYPNLSAQIKEHGHAIGNHGFLHLSGFTTCTNKYIENTNQGAIATGSHLFRPPYGRITPWQIQKLKKHHRLIMWTVMSMDFDQGTTPQRCLDNVIRNIQPGAIIVFHDTDKAAAKLLHVLPKLLTWIEMNGYKAASLPVLL